MIKEQILTSIREVNQAAASLLGQPALSFIENTARLLADTYTNGNKVLIAGNGGSLCDAVHFAEELTGNFRLYRKALPAIPLADPAHMTCVSNDFGFEWVFSRALEALGKKDDVFIGISTSGNSSNIINAFDAARELGLRTVSFLGKGGGKLKGVAELELCIDGFNTTDRIQEAHMAALHVIIETIEYLMFPEICIPSPETIMKS